MVDLKKELAAITLQATAVEAERTATESADAAAVNSFLDLVVREALSEFAEALKASGTRCEMVIGERAAYLTIPFGGEEFVYTVAREGARTLVPKVSRRDRDGIPVGYTGSFGSGSADSRMENLTKGAILEHLFGEYRLHVETRAKRPLR
jgi:hypothetical protein